MFDLAAAQQWVQQCATHVDHAVAMAIIKTESGFNPFAIGVNRGGRLAHQPNNLQTAIATAERLIADGQNIDMGYSQINSANLKRLGLTVTQVFDPCNNIRAMQFILSDCFHRAGSYGYQTKLNRAFSCYNTGGFKRGFENGYVVKINRNLQSYFSASVDDQQKQIRDLNSGELAKYASSLQVPDFNPAVVTVVSASPNSPVTPQISTASTDHYVIHTGQSDVFSRSQIDIFK